MNLEPLPVDGKREFCQTNDKVILSEKMDMFLAFDNDPAGKGYIRQFQERYSVVLFTLDFPPQEGQDWNDVLQSNQ